MQPCLAVPPLCYATGQPVCILRYPLSHFDYVSSPCADEPFTCYTACHQHTAGHCIVQSNCQRGLGSLLLMLLMLLMLMPVSGKLHVLRLTSCAGFTYRSNAGDVSDPKQVCRGFDEHCFLELQL